VNCLALDLGCNTGWAVNAGLNFFYGMEKFVLPAALRKKRMDRRLDPRIPAFRDFIVQLIDRCCVDTIMFEDVQFIEYRKQGQLWPSWRTAIWLVAHDREIRVDCLNTSSLKLHATGGGGASKERMISALRKLAPKLDFERIDDNVADAIWLWHWAQEHIRT